jgi:hypothetical protein
LRNITIERRAASRASARCSGRGFARGIEGTIGIVEEAERFLDLQHTPHGVIELRARHFAGLHERRQIPRIEAALHAHVDAREKCELRGVARTFGIAVRDELFVSRIVGDDEAAKSPLAAQDRREQRFVGARGHPVDVVERAHRRERAGVEGRLERRQVNLSQRLAGDLDVVVIQAAAHRAVGGEVLRRCEH